MALRTPGSPLAIVNQVRRAVTELDPNLPIYNGGTVALVLGAVGLPASLVPARRVSRVDPVLNLTAE